ncbi:hypothetical protein [Streptomyces sp. NPDC017988]|uniref:hypothetical protein n=1 Tax=Streptomyces sp. NPDC017988 TaxID=3365025 RepID=UPI0037AEC44F
MSSPETAFAYTLKPETVTAGRADQKLTLDGARKTKGTVTLKSLTLRIPRGAQDKHLTPDDAQALSISGFDDKHFKEVREPFGSEHFDIGIKSTHSKGRAVSAIGFTLSGLKAAHSVGTAEVIVLEEHPGESSPRTVKKSITKLNSAVFRIDGLQPKRWLVDGGEKSTVRWRVCDDKQHKVTGYRLDYTTPIGPVTQSPATTALSAEIGPLQQDTVVQLTASVKPPATEAVTITLTTYVAVAGPRLNQVGDLRARDTVELMGQPFNGMGPVPGYTRAFTRTGEHSSSFTATTDGLLVLSAETSSGATVTADLQLKNTAGTQIHTQHLVTSRQEGLSLPVPADYTAHLTTNAHSSSTAADRSSPAYWLTLDWHPLGVGPLT